MTDSEIANMLAAYHKECNETNELADKGRVQLKHARLIRKTIVKNCSTPAIEGQREQLKVFAVYAQKRMWEDGDKDLSEFIDDFLSL